MNKLRHQLAAADADERHAFLILGWEMMEAQCLIDKDESEALPGGDPTIPRPIDAIWITTTARGSQVLAWLPTVGWMHGATPP